MVYHDNAPCDKDIPTMEFLTSKGISVGYQDQENYFERR